ncbi:hypothetical protein SPBR_02722 [Sporothrix brasiliensis 5110]|uniref:Inositolphosphotransferase Aur1/Ipt1 domain-containing protein n=1 Tax=Sporothrix brasiliensis 5110 TaxID=1398154 RepID=A0A0C2J097_9PEZI|nr:uncharacterized protein SPBR_02722 [Sporothrix brasiliensis 5110]KIH92420.1 hypothetical protein SPBR_02722 [Sporothrix brasiliensis 5110]
MSGQHEDPHSKWRSKHIWKMPDEVESVLIVAILLIAMFTTRRKNYSIIKGDSTKSERFHQGDLPQSPSLTSSVHDGSTDWQTDYPAKYRRILGLWTVRTPNSSRFANHFHSRVLVKFPFVVEILYWTISFFFYRLTGVMAQIQYGGTEELWDVARGHGIAILELESRIFGLGENTGKERFAEYRIQQWYLTGADGGDFRGLWLTILDRGYSLIHIPGTAGFIAFYYWYAPNFNRFAIVRRMMTLLNMCAFLIFLLYPTMPPRFLPSEFGFIDTVNAEDARSVWMSGQFVNKLAAMPSMHFGYAFAIGCVFIYESGFLQQLFPGNKWRFVFDKEESEPDVLADAPSEDDVPEGFTRPTPLLAAGQGKSVVSRSLFLFFGIFYPSWILLTIVATANHYFLDALVATVCVLVAFLCNRVLLNFYPLEDWCLWVVRLEKPPPTTGWLRRKPSSPL